MHYSLLQVGMKPAPPNPPPSKRRPCGTAVALSRWRSNGLALHRLAATDAEDTRILVVDQLEVVIHGALPLRGVLVQVRLLDAALGPQSAQLLPTRPLLDARHGLEAGLFALSDPGAWLGDVVHGDALAAHVDGAGDVAGKAVPREVRSAEQDGLIERRLDRLPPTRGGHLSVLARGHQEKLATVLLLPLLIEVDQQVQPALLPGLGMNHVIKMHVEGSAGRVVVDAGPVEVWVDLELANPRNLLHQLQESVIVEELEEVLEHRRHAAAIIAGKLTLERVVVGPPFCLWVNVRHWKLRQQLLRERLLEEVRDDDVRVRVRGGERCLESSSVVRPLPEHPPAKRFLRVRLGLLRQGRLGHRRRRAGAPGRRGRLGLLRLGLLRDSGLLDDRHRGPDCVCWAKCLTVAGIAPGISCLAGILGLLETNWLP